MAISDAPRTLSLMAMALKVRKYSHDDLVTRGAAADEKKKKRSQSFRVPRRGKVDKS